MKIHYIVLIILVSNMVRTLYYLLSDSRIINKYNKYKIYKYQSSDETYYFAKVMVVKLFWCIPIYRNFEKCYLNNCGCHTKVVKFETEKQLSNYLESLYECCQKGIESKTTRIKNK